MITLDYDRLELELRNPRLRDERREANRAEHERQCRTRGNEYASRSKRCFRVAFVAEPKRDGKHVNGTQLLLDLCYLHEKPARAPRQVSRERALASIEKRGADAIEGLGEPVAKRSVSAWLTYISMGGEVLKTELHGLTPTEAAHIRRVSLRRNATRQVTWPAQSTAPILRVDHE